MSRFSSFSLGVLALIAVAVSANNALAAESASCVSQLQPDADAKFSSWAQAAFFDHPQRRHERRGMAVAQTSIAPTSNADLAQRRAVMKAIDDGLRALSKDQQENVFALITPEKLFPSPKTVRDVEFLHAIQFNGPVGWAIDYNGTLERTSDGGLNWTNVRLAKPGVLQYLNPHRGLFRNMHFADSQFGLIVGPAGVLESGDGGLSWNKLPKVTNFLLSAVFCGVDHTCWTAGDEQHVIYRRDNSHSAWSRQNTTATGIINGIQFIDSTGWAVSSNGDIIGTTDGGEHWTELFHGEGKHFRALHFIDKSVGWAVGHNALIMRTQDGGKIWVEQTIHLPPDFPLDQVLFNAVKFADATHGWAAGLHGIIFGTTDGGECWTRQRFEGLNAYWLTVYALAITEGPTIWAAGNTGNIFVSTDGGAFWFPVHGPAVNILEEFGVQLRRLGRLSKG